MFAPSRAVAWVAPTEGAPEAAAQSTTIVVLGVDGPEAAEYAEAISGHVHGLAEVVTSRARPATADDRGWYELAIREARSRSAAAVFWVDRVDDAHYVLSVVRPDRREIRWRRVEVDPTAPFAGIETLGVITRATTSALLADTALQMETTPIPEPAPAVAPAPAPTPVTPAAPRRARGRALLAVGYVGTSYARQIPWLSGLSFEAGHGWPRGVHATLGYAIYQRARAQTPVGRIEVARHPITALVGYHTRRGALGVGGDAGLVVDISRRRATSDAADIDVARDRHRVTTAITARARVSAVAVWRIEVFAALGVEAWLSGVRFGVEPQGIEPQVVLSPRRVRATATAGLAARI